MKRFIPRTHQCTLLAAAWLGMAGGCLGDVRDGDMGDAGDSRELVSPTTSELTHTFATGSLITPLATSATARLLAKDAGLTQERAPLGTLPLMSPEPVRSEDVDAWSDLFVRAGMFPARTRSADAMDQRFIGGAAC